MKMQTSVKRTAQYLYPVELVWKAIGGDQSRSVDPLSEDEFENAEPAPNTVFTKSLEVEPNKVFAFRMKTRGFIADLRLEMEPLGPCKTKVVFTEDVQFRQFSSYVLSKFGLSFREELKSFALELNNRLKDTTK